MAVVDPNPNITPAFAAVQQALQQRAEIERGGGARNPLSAINAIAAPVATQMDAARNRQFEIQKLALGDVLKNSQADLPPGTTLQDVMTSPGSVTLKPKVHTITQQDIDEAVKSFGLPPEHQHIFDDLVGQSMDEKSMNATLMKKVQFLHSSDKGNLTAVKFKMPDGTPVPGFLDKDKKKYFMSNGDEAPPNIEVITNDQFTSFKQQKFDEENLAKAEKRLDPTQRRAGTMADAQKRLNGIGRLKALFDGYANDLTSQEWEEASLAWASIIGQGAGQSSRAQIDALVPSTALANAKKAWQFISNNPTGTAQEKFAERIKQGMAREEKVNAGYVKDSQMKGLSGFQDTFIRKPDEARQMFENYGFTPEDVQKHYPKVAKALYPDLANKKEAPVPLSFASEAEAEKAVSAGKVKDGDIVTIAGTKHRYHK